MKKRIVKKEIFLLLFSFSLCVLAACKSEDNSRIAKNNQIDELFTKTQSEETERERYTIEYKPVTTEIPKVEATEYKNPALDENNPQYEPPIGTADKSVDMDFCVLTENMRLSMLYEYYSNPEKYIGKRVKISGLYRPYKDETTNKLYHYMIIYDKLACCENALEFIWDNNTHAYPDEYPKEGTEVTCYGTYESYDEQSPEGVSKTYYYIDIDKIEF